MIPQSVDMQYFLVLAETLNVTRASEKLVMAQSTISQSLKRLEETLGTELFIRRKNGLELTRAGELFRDKAQDLLDSWESLAEATRQMQDTPRGHFTIGAHTSVSLYTLPKILPKLIKENPHLNISLRHESSANILESVISGKIDFGLVINPIKHPDLVIKKICDDRYSFWKSKQCLNPEVLIMNKNVTANDILFKKKGPMFERQIHSESFEVIAELAVAGTGVALLPERVAKLFDLTQTHKEHHFEDSLFLCYRKERQQNMGGKTIRNTIVASLENLK